MRKIKDTPLPDDGENIFKKKNKGKKKFTIEYRELSPPHFEWVGRKPWYMWKPYWTKYRTEKDRNNALKQLSVNRSLWGVEYRKGKDL